MKAFAILLFLSVMMTGASGKTAPDYNALILREIEAMPKGGGYAVTREAGQALRRATVRDGEGRLRLEPAVAKPSYCSGATYLLFLRVVEKSPAAPGLDWENFAVRGQPDGHGIWGRWNANGPGTARLFYELGLGRNFSSWEEARAGDFMKIFWTKEVGQKEFGHLVVYLGRHQADGKEWVSFWSSNKPDGYGVKEVERGKIAHAIFSRLEHPERLTRPLPKVDPYLASLLKVRSSIAEAHRQSGISRP